MKKFFDSNTGKLLAEGELSGYRRINRANPAKGIYEYAKPEITENQSLGKIVVIDGVATNEIIDFEAWTYPDYPVRITVREKLIKPNGDLTGLGQTMAIAPPVQDPPLWIDNRVYRRAYFSYLLTDDGFTLTDGVITSSHENVNNPSQYFHIEQIHNNFEIGIKDDSEAIVEKNAQPS